VTRLLVLPQNAALASAIGEQMPGSASKKIQATSRGPKPAYVAASDEAEQTAYLCSEIKQRWERDEPLAQMAVLARTHAALLPVQIALRNAGIPYQVAVHEEADVDHIRQVVARMELGANLQNKRALKTVLQSFQDIKPSEVTAIIQAVQTQGPKGLHGHPKAPYAEDLKRLRAMLKQMSPRMEAEKAAQMAIDCFQPILRRQVKRVGPYLLKLSQVKLYARSFLSLEDAVSDLRTWFEEVAPKDRVVLSTMHAAKGLEWDRVFVIGLIDGILPIHHALAKARHLNEERRLWYVAVTRAKSELHLVSAPVKLPRVKYRKPSRFIAEIRDFPRLTQAVKVK
jgi:DNA helicase-2/ATP-dependent DNA helicase PcrA